MGNNAAWAGLGQAIQTGSDAYSKAKAAKAEAERAAMLDAEKKREFDTEMEFKNRQLNATKLNKGGMPPGIKLGPDQRWNPQTETVEIIPGTKTYQGQAEKYAKDQGALSSVKQKTGGGIQAIEDFMAMPGALESQFGKGYSGLATRYMNPDARNRLENIKATVRSSGLDMMRQGGSIGQMTEREWPMVEQLMANISNSSSEEEAKFQFEKVKAKLKNIADEAERIREQEWGNTPFTQPMRTGPKDFVPSQPPGAQVGGSVPQKKYSIISVE